MLTFQICCIAILIVHVLKAEQNVSQQKDSHDCSHEELHRSDRLLLNDPSLYDRRLQQLESQVQSLTSKLHLAETTISQLSQSNKGILSKIGGGPHAASYNISLKYLRELFDHMGVFTLNLISFHLRSGTGSFYATQNWPITITSNIWLWLF